MGRKRKDLKLHKVKGYYSTYSLDSKTQYKYFGTPDPEVAYQACRKWRAALRRAETAGMTLAEMSAATKRKNMALLKQWARFVLSLPDDYDGTEDDRRRRYKRWLGSKNRGKSGSR